VTTSTHGSTHGRSGGPTGAPGGAVTRPRPPVGELVFAGGVAALAVYVIVGAGSIVTPVSAGAVGPRVLPYLVGGAMLLAALASIAGILRGHTAAAEEGEDIDPNANTDWRTVGLLAGLVVLHIFLIVPVGWPIAAAVLFTGAAWVLGATSKVRAAVIGTLLAFGLQIAFAGGLGVSLPPGPFLEGVAILRG
jgi:putative tricarboxylic transport membrane protein